MSTEVVVRLFIPTAIAIIMLSMGLGLVMADFERVLEKPRGALAGALAQLVGLPLLGFAVASLFGLPGPLAVGVVLLTACPGGPSSNLYTYYARGDVALSVTLTAISGFATIVTIPLWVNLALSTYMGDGRVQLPIITTMLNILAVVGVPLVLGMYARANYPTAAARAERWAKRLAVLMLVILIVGAVAKERARIVPYLATLALPILTLCTVSILFGFAVGYLTRLGPRGATTLAIEVGMQNGSLGIGLAMANLTDEIAMPSVVYGLLAYFSCGAALLVGRRINRLSTSVI